MMIHVPDVGDRVISRDCAGCGRPIQLRTRGRPAVYCSSGCRQRAWALRRADAVAGTARDPRPPVVREVVERQVQPERIVYVPAPAPPPPVPPPAAPLAIPDQARGWVELLDQLTAQLADPTSRLAREHWQHRRVYGALAGALNALHEAHPGGLALLDPGQR